MIKRFITSTVALIMTLMLTHMPAYAAGAVLLQDVKTSNTADGFFMLQSKGADYSVKSPFPVSEGHMDGDDKTGRPEMNIFATAEELSFEHHVLGGVITFKNKNTKEFDLLNLLSDAAKRFDMPAGNLTIHNIQNGKASYLESHNDKAGIIGIIFESDTKLYRVLCIYPIENKEDHSRCEVAIDSFQINGMAKIDWASLK